MLADGGDHRGTSPRRPSNHTEHEAKGDFMSTRRSFIARSAAAAAGVALAPADALAARARPAPRSGAPLRILILGGTGFLGPYLVHFAKARGHQLTMLNRGQREPGLFEDDYAGVEVIEGDRALPTGHDGLRGKTWDAVIETSGYRHPWTRDAVGVLRGAAPLYLYVSSTGVFWPYHTTNIPEDGRILLADDPPAEQPSYGVMKALSENEVRDAFGAGAIIVRPGYIVGPGDTSDRWTYWPVRVARGGEILVPGRKVDPVQYIDVRDLTEWMITLVENGTTGDFNAVGPARPQTMEEFVYGLGATTGAPLSWTWIEDYDFLKAYPLRRSQSGETSGLTYSVPWIMPEGDDLGHMQIDGRKAFGAGLTLRPLAVTAMDTVAWRLSDAPPQALRDQPRYVLTPEQERDILAAWKRRAG
jgi:2'-hydroxyisoflavone reductase